MEKVTVLNKDWRFRKENGDWEQITVPHTWNGKDGQDGTGMWRGKGIYERVLLISEEDLEKVVYLEIGAASLESKVYVNGQHIYTNACPYSLYRVPMNGYIHVGENTLLIEVDNSHNDNIYPQMADFSFYGGLYRNVNLIVAEKMHFDYLDGSRDGVYVSAEKETEDTWNLQVRGSVINKDTEYTLVVNCKVKDKEGNIAAQKKVAVSVNEQADFAMNMEVLSPHLWNGRKDPYLYDVIVTLEMDGTVVDERKIPFGFRTIEITADKGFFLNGEHIKLRGVARHQDFGDLGYAVSEKERDIDMDILLEMGANSVRLSHYQHDDYFYRLCDEKGILAWAEVPFISTVPTGEEAYANIEAQMERLIKQCYNHCAVYCWGVQNEISITGETETLYGWVSRLEQYVKSMDPTRYTAEANISTVENTSRLNELTDIVGYNLYYGWYYKTIPDLQVRLDEIHADCPNMPLLVTEYGVDTNPGYHSYEPAVKDYTEEYQLEFSKNAIEVFEERDFVTGSYVWNMADFGSENRDEGGNKGKNQKGLVTMDRKFKKDAYYLYKAYWSDEPFVKLAGSRFINRHKEENTITILNNVSKLELFVDGILVGKKEVAEPVTKFVVNLTELGEHTVCVKAFDENGNGYEDSMVLQRVEEPDKSYIAERKDNRVVVVNWFEKFDLSDTTEVELDENGYTTGDTISLLMEKEESRAILEKYLEFLFHDPRFMRVKGMTVDALFGLGSLGLPKELKPVLNRELNKIKR